MPRLPTRPKNAKIPLEPLNLKPLNPSLPIEPLEPRTLLTAATPTLDLFNASPPLFVENQGQWPDPAVRYAFDGAGASIAFTAAGPVFRLFPSTPANQNTPHQPNPPSSVMLRYSEASTSDDGLLQSGPDASEYLGMTRGPAVPGDLGTPEATAVPPVQFSMTFPGSNPVLPTPLEPSASKFNYFLNDPSTWRSNVPGYQKLAYKNLYDGIDLATWGRRNGLKYEFHVAPNADYRQIQVSYHGITTLSIDDTGALHIQTPAGDLIETAPFIYQDLAGQRQTVAGSYALIGNDTYTFALTGPYDPARELIIDPDLTWSTYLGGSGSDWDEAIAVDGSDNVLVTGMTNSSGWTSGGFNTSFNGARDAFVAKLSPSGEHLWSTYLGGSGDDFGHGIAVDGSGNVLATGRTNSSGWTSGGFDNSFNGGDDAFVAKLSPSGEHLWSTYLGGSGGDYGFAIAVDDSDNVLVTGPTNSSGWTSGGFDNSYNGGSPYYFDDAFVAKLSPSGEHLWSTYLGGSTDDEGRGIAVDSSDNVLVTGLTRSSGWISGGFDNSFNGARDAFVAKLSPSGEHLWCTYLGGSGDDFGHGIAVDGSGNVLVTGMTNSSGWTSGGFDNSFNGGDDAFVAKLGPSGEHLWSTYLGGSGGDYGFAIAVDDSDNVLVTGQTNSSGWTSGGFDNSYNGNQDAFVAKLSPSGAHLWCTYLGGLDYDRGNGIAVDGLDNVLVTGQTNSSGWTRGGFDTSHDGSEDAFVAKISRGTAEGTAGPDTFYLTRSGDDLLLYNSPTPTGTPTTFAFASLGALTFNALAGDDTLILDFANGNPLPSAGLNFNDGEGSDTIILTGTLNYEGFILEPTRILYEDTRLDRLGPTAIINLTSTESIALTSPTQDLALAYLTLASTARAQILPGSHTLRLGALTLDPAATLDLKDNDLLIATGDLPTIESLINDRWTGPGLVTSILTDYTTLGAIPKADGSILVKYTYYGDVNGDGAVNLHDYFIIDSNYLSQSTGTPLSFHHGDVNYDGRINLNDYFLIDQAYLAQTAPLSSSLFAASPSRRFAVSSPKLRKHPHKKPKFHRTFSSQKRIR